MTIKILNYTGYRTNCAWITFMFTWCVIKVLGNPSPTPLPLISNLTFQFSKDAATLLCANVWRQRAIMHDSVWRKAN